MTEQDKDDIIVELREEIAYTRHLMTEIMERSNLMIDKLEHRCARIESKLCEFSERAGYPVCGPNRRDY